MSGLYNVVEQDTGGPYVIVRRGLGRLEAHQDAIKRRHRMENWPPNTPKPRVFVQPVGS